MSDFYNKNITEEYINLDEINRLIYSLYNILAKYSEKHYLGVYYGYYNIDKYEEIFYTYSEFLQPLYNIRDRLLLDANCGCYHDFNNGIEIIKAASKACDQLRMDLIVDSSNYDEWLLSNPDKIAYEAWEACLMRKCAPITYSLIKDLTRDRSRCAIGYELVKEIEKCYLSFDLLFTKKDCSVDYELLLKNIPDCRITYEDYVNLRNCGVTAQLISKSAECGISLEVDNKEKCVNFIYNLKKYQLNCYE